MAIPNRDLNAPPVPALLLTSSTSLLCASSFDEKDWLKMTQELVAKEKLDAKDMSWAAYRASQGSLTSYEPAIITLLPMFVENAHSLAMIAHSMRVIKAAVQHVNPEQTPVIALDQPLFALAKQIQWAIPEFSEQNIVVMLGGLQIEIASFKMLGKWVAGSGWSDVMCNAGVATQGIADSFLTASHVTRTRRAHQVTAASLHILMNTAYEAYKVNQQGEEQGSLLSLEHWKEAMKKKSPNFLYWDFVLKLELICLRLVRSFREANFPLYINALQELIPWMFAMDHPNYARWLSVHYRDMRVLSQTQPDVFKHFNDGSFVVHKTIRAFFSIALDHAHEQINVIIKGEGGAVGLTENPAALRRWMVAGPELARMVQEFEETSSQTEEHSHHEQKSAVQLTFFKDVVNTVSYFEQLGNPFQDEGDSLMAVHTKDIIDDAVLHTIQNAREIGEKQFQLIVKERFVYRTKPVTEPLKKNNLPTFNNPCKKMISKDKARVQVLKEDCSLFSRLYIASQTRDGNLEEFFEYEDQPWPPSLSELGQLRGG